MKLLFVKFPFGTEMRMSQQNHEGGWSGIGMATVGIHPNDFDLYPNKIPPGRVVQNCPCFHLRKQRLKESHIQLFAQDIPPSLLLVDFVCALQSPNSHFCQMPSDIFLSFANKSKWLLYHKAQHRAPYLCFTSFP